MRPRRRATCATPTHPRPDRSLVLALATASPGEEPFARAKPDGLRARKRLPTLGGWQLHAASRSRLRFRTWLCRSACCQAARAFSSNRTGKTSSGYCVTQAKAAASFAARRKELRSRESQIPSDLCWSNWFLRRSSSPSCLACNSAGGAGITSNPTSGANSAGTHW